MKFEYEGIIKKKKDKRTWQVSLCVSFSVENMEGGWQVSCGPLLALMGLTGVLLAAVCGVSHKHCRVGITVKSEHQQ